MGFVKRKATIKAKEYVKAFEEIKKLFLLDAKNVVEMDEICEDMIVNWDQTRVDYVQVSSRTMEQEGSKRIELIGIDNKRQLTVLFAGSLSGDLLPIQTIYQGKSLKCSNFLKGVMLHTENFILLDFFSVGPASSGVRILTMLVALQLATALLQSTSSTSNLSEADIQ